MAEQGGSIVGFVHAETSTGAQSDAKLLTQIAHKYGALTIVDAVTSLAGTMARYYGAAGRLGIDVLYGADVVGVDERDLVGEHHPVAEAAELELRISSSVPSSTRIGAPRASWPWFIPAAPAIFSEEFEGLVSVVAQNVSVELAQLPVTHVGAPITNRFS